MNEAEYRNAIEEYKYYYGDTFLISDKKVPPQFKYPKTASEDPCGNGIIYLCMHIIKLKINGWLKDEDIRLFREMIFKCQPMFIGLVQRSPNKPDYQSHDDLIMLCETLKALGFPPNAIAHYLESEHWVYNTQDPGKFAWKAFLRRFLHFRAHVKWCVGIEPIWYEKLVWKYTVNKACSAPITDHTSWLLTWSMVEACDDLDLQIFSTKWMNASRNAFPGPNRIEAIFANALEAGHPIGRV